MKKEQIYQRSGSDEIRLDERFDPRPTKGVDRELEKAKGDTIRLRRTIDILIASGRVTKEAADKAEEIAGWE